MKKTQPPHREQPPLKPQRISIVLANWCPHCVPPSIDATRKMSADIGVPLRILDIDDPESEKVADDLVRKYGDECEDYLIPQVFLEFPEKRVQHVFTGFSENPDVTKKHWDDFFSSEYYRSLKN